MNRNIRLLLLLMVFALLVSCGSNGPVGSTTSVPSVTPTPSVTTEIAPQEEGELDPIAAQIATMSTQEKVGQLLTVGFAGTTPGPEVATYLEDCHVGGFILFGRNIETVSQTVDLTNGLKEMNPSDIPLFMGVDQEGGLVDRMPDEILSTPSAYTVGQFGDSDLVYDYGTALGLACAGLGFNIDFAPSVDVWSNANNTVIGKRALSTDFEQVATLAPYAVQGISDTGVIPVVKHFPGHGDTDVDSHTALPIVYKEISQLWAEELRPFQAVLEGETDTGVMVSHLLLPALDDTYPASLSYEIITGLLRGEMGFGGLIITDDMTMGAITNDYDLPEACLLAVQAGCDVLLVCHGTDSVATVYNTLLDAVQGGQLTQERLDESVYRILTAKAALSDEAIDTPDVAAINQAIGKLG